ncbi:MAG: glycine cleavage system aminomethyltransferase GcvT [Ignavibacteriales bacterium]|nr:glycine cleavage system aminomethyltransferase GcvT [Ignavibacteriales bacterium]
MKQTAFTQIHRQLGAKLIEFGGFEMPVHYTGIIEEHKAVRTSVGVFDVSHMGEIFIKGKDTLALVQRLTTNDASKLNVGKVQYSAMCYPDGGIVDDLLVYRMEDYFMLVVNASNMQKDFDWMKSNVGSLQVEVINKRDDFSLLAVQGPQSLATLQKLTDANLSVMPYYTFVQTKLAGVEMIVSRTGYTGEIGFELYFDSKQSLGEQVWMSLMESGKEFNIKPIGLGVRDTLRLEMGFCLYGNDIDQSTNPLEAGLGWITKLSKGDFIGRDVLQKVQQDGLKRKLVGFIVDEEKAFPRHGYELRSNERTIGVVTSGTLSPILEKGIGMGYVPTNFSEIETPVEVAIRNKNIKARVTKLPFIKR